MVAVDYDDDVLRLQGSHIQVFETWAVHTYLVVVVVVAFVSVVLASYIIVVVVVVVAVVIIMMMERELFCVLHSQEEKIPM